MLLKLAEEVKVALNTVAANYLEFFHNQLDDNDRLEISKYNDWKSALFLHSEDALKWKLAHPHFCVHFEKVNGKARGFLYHTCDHV